MQTSTYKVSILVPIYGVEKYIERCAISLLEQTYGNLEYIFVDDCGKDRSIEILKNVVSRYPDRIDCVKIVTHEHNRGLAAARNTAVEAATGEFVMHVDSDDWVDRTIVEKLMNEQCEKGADIVMSDFKVISSDYEDIVRRPDINDNFELCLKQLQQVASWNLVGQIIRRNLYLEHNIRASEGCNMGEDLHTSPRLSYFATGGVSYVHEPLYYYNRCNERSYTMTFNESICRQVDGSYGVLENFFSNKGEQFVDAIHISRLNTYIGYLRRMSLMGGFDELYENYRRRVAALAPRYAKRLSIFKRVSIILAGHRKLLKLMTPRFITS